MSLIGDFDFDYDGLPDNYNFNFRLFEYILKKRYELNVDFANRFINGRIVTKKTDILKRLSTFDVNYKFIDEIRLQYLMFKYMKYDEIEEYNLTYLKYSIQNINFHRKFPFDDYIEGIGFHKHRDTRNLSTKFSFKIKCIIQELLHVSFTSDRVNHKKIWNTINRLNYLNYTRARISCNIKYIRETIREMYVCANG